MQSRGLNIFFSGSGRRAVLQAKEMAVSGLNRALAEHW